MRRLLLAFCAGVLASAIAIAATPWRTPGTGGEAIRLVGATGAASKQGITNSLEGRPILTVTNLKPGGSVSAQVTLQNTGSAPQNVWGWQSALTYGPTGRPNLSTWARLTVYDAATARTVYSGIYSGFPALAQPVQLCGIPTKKNDLCPAWAKNESHTFTFTVTFPDAASGSGVNINTYQSTWIRSEFDWASAE